MPRPLATAPGPELPPAIRRAPRAGYRARRRTRSSPTRAVFVHLGGSTRRHWAPISVRRKASSTARDSGRRAILSKPRCTTGAPCGGGDLGPHLARSLGPPPASPSLLAGHRDEAEVPHRSAVGLRVAVDHHHPLSPPGAASAWASPEMPAPTIATSYDCHCGRHSSTAIFLLNSRGGIRLDARASERSVETSFHDSASTIFRFRAGRPGALLRLGSPFAMGTRARRGGEQPPL